LVIYPPAWNGKTGGVLVIVADDVTIESYGRLNASRGYHGGEKRQQGESWTGLGKARCAANGGGGGCGNSDQGGAGASFGTDGCLHADKSDIDPTVGIKYDPFSQIPNTLLGSGGGSSDEETKGGNGGGAIIIRAHTLRNDGEISCIGGDGFVSGSGKYFHGGGGGSGGLVLIVANHVEGSGCITVQGGKGGLSDENIYNYIPRSLIFRCGGNGGDGHIIIRSPDAQSISTGQMKCKPAAKLENNLDFPDLSSLNFI
jgi:hypothetical protein